MSSPRLVSIQEAARITGRAPSLLRRWVAQGRIPAVMVGRTYALTPEALAAIEAMPKRKARPPKGPGS